MKHLAVGLSALPLLSSNTRWREVRPGFAGVDTASASSKPGIPSASATSDLVLRSWRRVMFLALWALAVLGLAGCAATPMPGPISAAPTADEALALAVWSDRRPAQYRIGETLELKLHSNLPAHIVVLNINALQQTTVLLPNVYSNTQNRLGAGQVQIFPGLGAPFVLRVAGPPGNNWIRVIATTYVPPLDVQALAPYDEGPFAIYAGSPESLLRQVQSPAQHNPERQWAFSDYHFEVIP